jgi:hypothetical protein
MGALFALSPQQVTSDMTGALLGNPALDASPGLGAVIFVS